MMTTVWIVHAQRNDMDHAFMEIFTTEAKMNDWITANRNRVTVTEKTIHETDPVGPVVAEKFIRLRYK
jgi:hypothetical protein